MGKNNKRRRKILVKGFNSLKKRSDEHKKKADSMKKTPESRSYALKEAEQFEIQARMKELKAKKLKKK